MHRLRLNADWPISDLFFARRIDLTILLVQNKVEQNSLEGSAFARLDMHELRMLFLGHEISFLIE